MERGERMRVGEAVGVAVVVVLLAIMGVGCGREAASAEAEARVKATIDAECGSHPGSLVVAEGQTASGFQVVEFKAGAACHEAGAPENKGYAIHDRNHEPVYLWSQYQDQKPYERGGPLERLQLKSGEYTVVVAGGAGAAVELSCQLK